MSGIGPRRNRTARRVALVVLALSPLVTAPVAASDLQVEINWPAFLARNDMVWTKVPESWESGAFLGNGLLGANVYATPDGRHLQWRIGRTDVVYRGSRIPVGDLVLKTAGVLQRVALRLDLWNAELVGTITTDKGTIGVRSFTHTQDLVQVVELSPSAGETGLAWEWRPGEAINPRYRHNSLAIPPEEVNPPPRVESEGEVTAAVQELKTGGGHVAAWTSGGASKERRTFFATVGYSTADLGAARSEARAALEHAKRTGLPELATTHRRWWNSFYPKSFLSLPDRRLESFYWIQLYKMASGTRADRPLLDLMGPWFRTTPWPRIWWNLNLQLTYWPQLVSNHLDLGESLLRSLDTHKEALARNAEPFGADSYAIGRSSSYDLERPARPEIGNLTWALHNYYLHYRYAMDEALLRDRLFPLLKGSVNYYLHLLKEGEDGHLHIPLGLSPEYPGQPTPNPDTNYDLALLRWGATTLLEICERFQIDDPQIPTWKRTLERLVPYPVDANGYKVSASMPFAVSHRHYSHLMMVYPLYLVNLDQPENRDLVVKSLNHWMGLESALRGYSFTGASSISSIMGRGDDAARYLDMLFAHGRFGIHPNTMYTEAGPVIETPLSAARSLQDMVLSSWGGKVRVFPAVPGAWPDVTFHRLRTEGAFLVSAVRRRGATELVHIESLAGEPCLLVTDMPDPGGAGVTVTKVGAREYRIDLQKGQAVVLTPGGSKAVPTIAPVAAQAGRVNYWGRNGQSEGSK